MGSWYETATFSDRYSNLFYKISRNVLLFECLVVVVIVVASLFAPFRIDHLFRSGLCLAPSGKLFSHPTPGGGG